MTMCKLVDKELVSLVNQTKNKLAGIGMRNARPSEILAAKEDFKDQFVALLGTATDNIPDSYKIAMFDELAKNHISELLEEMDTKYFDDDCVHCTWEEVRKAVLGPNIFDATNELEKLLP